MGLVDDHETRTYAQEFISPTVRFYVVEGNYRVGIDLEDGLVRPEVAFQARDRAGSHHFRFNAEFFRKLLLPLLAQVRRTDDGKPFDFPAVEKFPDDQAGFYGLADADVVRDQETYGVQPECQKQRRELIRSRDEVDVAETSERSRSRPQLQKESVSQEQGGLLRARFVRIGQVESRRNGPFGLKRQVYERGVVFRSAERTKFQKVVSHFGEDHPFAPPRPDQGSRFELVLRLSGRAPSVFHRSSGSMPGPKTHAYSSVTRFQDIRSAENRTTVKPPFSRSRVILSSRAFWAPSSWCGPSM